MLGRKYLPRKRWGMKKRKAWAGILILLIDYLGLYTALSRLMSPRLIALRFPTQIRNRALAPQRFEPQRATLAIAERRFLVR
jgi:hypothetical protein